MLTIVDAGPFIIRLVPLLGLPSTEMFTLEAPVIEIEVFPLIETVAETVA